MKQKLGDSQIEDFSSKKGQFSSTPLVLHFFFFWLNLPQSGETGPGGVKQVRVQPQSGKTGQHQLLARAEES